MTNFILEEAPKAILIGTAVYSELYNDIDLIANQAFVDYYGLDNSSRVSSKYCGVVYYQPEKYEICVPNSGTAYHYLLNNAPSLYKEVSISQNAIAVNIASIQQLAALKKAHLILPHKWEHHINEYAVLKQMLNVEHFTPKEHGVGLLYKKHRKECRAMSKKHPKLNMSKDSFFEDAEFKIFDHDDIHRAVAIDDVPAYTLMQDGEVWCSKEKWNKMTERQKLNCVIEEASVLALERSIIPALFLNRAYAGAKWAYRFALEKISTTITSGWFRDYCIESYHQALDNQIDFNSYFINGLKNNKIKVLKPEVVYGDTQAPQPVA